MSKHYQSGNIALWIVFAVVIAGIIFAAVRVGNNSVANIPEAIDTPAEEILTLSSEENLVGDIAAPIALIEYSDFQCPACAAYEPMIKNLIADYGDNMAFAYRHFPLSSIHPNARAAAQAAEAAGMQGAFFEMHDLLFENQNEWSGKISPRSDFTKYAEELGLDVDQFNDDYNSDAVLERLNTDVAEAQSAALNLDSTPSFFLNGEQLPSGLSEQNLRELFDAILNPETTEAETAA